MYKKVTHTKMNALVFFSILALSFADNCAPGYFSDNGNSIPNSCQPCAAGYVSYSPGSTFCDPCPVVPLHLHRIHFLVLRAL